MSFKKMAYQFEIVGDTNDLVLLGSDHEFIDSGDHAIKSYHYPKQHKSLKKDLISDLAFFFRRMAIEVRECCSRIYDPETAIFG